MPKGKLSASTTLHYTRAEWDKADDKRNKAYAEWAKAYATIQKAGG